MGVASGAVVTYTLEMYGAVHNVIRHVLNEVVLWPIFPFSRSPNTENRDNL